MSSYTRRRVLAGGAPGVAALLAGCMQFDAGRSPDTETRVVVRNHDPMSAHQLSVRLLDPEAESSGERTVGGEDAYLDPATETAEDVEAGPDARTSFRVQSRPYLIRVHVNRSDFAHDPYHFHYRPCHRNDPDVLDKLFVTVQRPDSDDVPSVYFAAFC